MRKVQRERVVFVRCWVPAGPIRQEVVLRVRSRSPRVHVFHRHRDPITRGQFCHLILKLVGITRLPHKWWMHDDGGHLEVHRHLAGAAQLGGRITAPHRLANHQAGRVQGGNRLLPALRQTFQLIGVLRDRVGPDHHFHAVVAQFSRRLERMMGPQRVDRHGGERDSRFGAAARFVDEFGRSVLVRR